MSTSAFDNWLACLAFKFCLAVLPEYHFRLLLLIPIWCPTSLTKEPLPCYMSSCLVVYFPTVVTHFYPYTIFLFCLTLYLKCRSYVFPFVISFHFRTACCFVIWKCSHPSEHRMPSYFCYLVLFRHITGFSMRTGALSWARFSAGWAVSVPTTTCHR